MNEKHRDAPLRGTQNLVFANTNKLLKQYQWTTGLKTGSTSKAKYCVSATAEKDGVELIAVIMACPNYKLRFAEAETLFNYGYSNCKLYKDETPEALPRLNVLDGKTEDISLKYDSVFSYLSTTGEDLSSITKEWNYIENPSAPISEGDVVGTLTYRLGDTILGSFQHTGGRIRGESRILGLFPKALIPKPVVIHYIWKTMRKTLQLSSSAAF